ncbi:MAG: HAMP domain-containing sensor histidine kinase [Longimicrobiales bacterium]
MREQLILTVVIVSVLMSAPAIYAVSRLNALKGLTDVATIHGKAYSALGSYGKKLGDVNRIESSYLVTVDPATRIARESALAEARNDLDSLDAAGYSTETKPARSHLDRIEAMIRDIDGMLAAGDKERATATFDRVKDQFAAAQNSNDVILNAIGEQARRGTERATEITTSAVTTTEAVIAVALAIALAIGAYMTRMLLRPVAQLRHSMARVAGGSFDVQDNLPFHRHDEIGDLSRSFRGMTQRLADLDKLKAEFMSISTHELKTPINVIGGYAELIQEGVYGDINEKQDTALKSIREQSKILTQMVNQLLDVSRIEAGGMQLEMHEVVVRDLLERVQRTFMALAQKQDIIFEVKVEPNTPNIVPGDSDRLRDQVLGNLISNAFKFTPGGGRVEVRAWQEDQWLYLCVEDTGAGIPEEQQAHVFDKFYQVAGKARSKGAGLGLTIAHEVVHGHGGEISVRSEPGTGTTFELRLPTTREQAALAHAAHARRVDDRAAVVAEAPEH